MYTHTPRVDGDARRGSGISPAAFHPQRSYPCPTQLLATFLQPFERSWNGDGYFHPTAAADGSPGGSPGMPPVLTWKTKGRRLLPRVIFPTSAVWHLRAQGLNQRCTICRYLWAEAAPGSHSKAAACCSSPAFASPRKTSINYRNGQNPFLQCLLNVTSCFWKYLEA